MGTAVASGASVAAGKVGHVAAVAAVGVGAGRALTSDELVKKHMPLVEALAYKLMHHVPKHVERSDIVSEGYIGLVEASRRFDPSRGNKFETFARNRIHGAMVDWLRSLDPLPRSARDEVKKIEAAERVLTKEHGRPVGEQEVADHLGVSLSDHQQKLINLSCRVVSIEGSLKGSESGSGSFSMDLRDESTKDPIDVIQAADFWQNLLGALQALPEREKLVLSLMCLEGLNLKEVGSLLDYSPSTIRQTRERAMVTIREYLGTVVAASGDAEDEYGEDKGEDERELTSA